MAEIILRIEGHDWRYMGGNMAWNIPKGETPNWRHLTPQPFSTKSCVTCGWEGRPSHQVEPCAKLWTQRTGHTSQGADGTVYRSTKPKDAE